MISLWIIAFIPLLYAAGWIIWYYRFGGMPEETPVIISFHKITNRPELGGTFNTERQFRAFMHHISEYGYTTPGLHELIEKGEEGIAVFFDDAYENIYDTAYRIMKPRNLNGVLCPIVSFIGKMNSWDRGINRYAHMNWEQLREMSNAGFDIVSHSMTHRDLRKLSDEELEYEISESRNVLQNKLGCDVDYFMYPFGLYNNRVKNAVKKAGYKGAFASYASDNRRMDKFAIGRNSMYIIDSNTTLRTYLRRNNLFLYGHEETKGRIINWFARFSAYMEL